MIRTGIRRWTASDVFDAVLVVFCAAFALWFAARGAPVFRKMYSDFHVDPGPLAEWATTPWVILSVGAVPIAIVIASRAVAGMRRLAPALRIVAVILTILLPPATLFATESFIFLVGPGDTGLDLPAGRSASGRYLGPGLPR